MNKANAFSIAEYERQPTRQCQALQSVHELESQVAVKGAFANPPIGPLGEDKARLRFVENTKREKSISPTRRCADFYAIYLHRNSPLDCITFVAHVPNVDYFRNDYE